MLFESIKDHTKSFSRPKIQTVHCYNQADSREETIVLDVNDYVGKCERQSGNTKYYKKLKHSPTARNNETVHKVFLVEQKTFFKFYHYVLQHHLETCTSFSTFNAKVYLANYFLV